MVVLPGVRRRVPAGGAVAAADVTGSYRGALLSLLVLFVSGGGLLAATDTDRAVAAARQADADAEEGTGEGAGSSVVRSK